MKERGCDEAGSQSPLEVVIATELTWKGWLKGHYSGGRVQLISLALPAHSLCPVTVSSLRCPLWSLHAPARRKLGTPYDLTCYKQEPKSMGSGTRASVLSVPALWHWVWVALTDLLSPFPPTGSQSPSHRFVSSTQQTWTKGTCMSSRGCSEVDAIPTPVSTQRSLKCGLS